MKISSYNINGIRAANKKGFTGWVQESNPDIICIQELRADELQIPQEISILDYYQYYHTAEKKGYSGVSIFSKKEPISVTKGMGVDWIDREGRVLIAEYEEFEIMSVYIPSGSSGDLRQELKMEFLDDFIQYTEQFVNNRKPMLICGDFNICHKEIDIHNPEKQHKTSGFLPEERAWVTDFLDAGYEDVFRKLNPDTPDLYSWWSYRAASKQRNKGWRIDYHMATKEISQRAKKSEIEKKWNISDHAPVTIEYDL